ncbi:hypothetical protein, partial [Enterococcus faecium]
SGTTSDAVFVGTNSGVPYYHDVRITIDRVKLQNVPHDFHVTPGMFVEADIKVGYHTVFDYFVERIWPYVEESMREPT